MALFDNHCHLLRSIGISSLSSGAFISGETFQKAFWVASTVRDRERPHYLELGEAMTSRTKSISSGGEL